MMEKVPPTLVSGGYSKRCYIQCEWEAAAETPARLAARFACMIDALARIDPLLSLWNCGDIGCTPYELVRDYYAEEIAENVSRDDWGEPDAKRGYFVCAITRDTPRNRSFAASGWAGAIVGDPFANSVEFSTSVTGDADPDVMTYRIFRPAITAIAQAWEPVKAAAYTEQLRGLPENRGWFPMPWIQYLSPWLAQKITPPSTALVERLPDGGLVMSATTESFDVDNPRHMAVAADIANAMAPLERLPWPSPDLPKAPA